MLVSIDMVSRVKEKVLVSIDMVVFGKENLFAVFSEGLREFNKQLTTNKHI